MAGEGGYLGMQRFSFCAPMISLQLRLVPKSSEFPEFEQDGLILQNPKKPLLMNNLRILTASISLLAGAIAHADVLYQDSFENDGLATNSGIGGGAANRTINVHSWTDDGSANFSTVGRTYTRRAVLYSENTFQSTGGFTLTVDYYTSSVGTRGATALSFGLISDDTNLSTFGGFNPFGEESGVYSIGANLINTGVRGLNFTDGTPSSLQPADFVEGADTSVIIQLENDGSGGADWALAVGGEVRGSGNIPSFDFSQSYHFAAYGQDDAYQRRINSVKLESLGGPVVVPPNPEPNPEPTNPSAQHYVATTGSNSNNGSINRPYRTIQHAVNQLRPGDTLNIRGGSYHEEIDLSGVSGSNNDPITITNYNDEEVVLDGTVSITSNWSRDSGSVYKTTLSEDVTQLFVDGEPMTLARFPNALAFSDDAFTGNNRRFKEFDSPGGAENGYVVDDPTRGAPDGLAASGVSYNGCIGVFQFGDTEAKLVSGHTAGTGDFDYRPLFNKYRTRRAYFFEGGVGDAERVMLDIAQEWAYDETSKTLYLWADDSRNPNGRSIRGKTLAYAISGDASTKNVTIDGLNFFGSTFSFDSSDNITIQNCDLDYFAASTRAVGDLGRAKSTRFVGTPSDLCENITIYNCSFSHADGRALYANLTKDFILENNYFYKIDYAVVSDLADNAGFNPFASNTSIELRGMDGLLYRRNTVDTAGGSQTISYGKAGTTTAEKLTRKPAIFEFNYHTGCASRADDGSTIYMAHTEVVESITRNNWFYGNHERDLRFDGNNRQLEGVRGNVYRNVSMDSGARNARIAGDGYRLKGSFHEIYNNLGVNDRATLNVALDKGGNADTVTRNNVAQNFTDDPIPGTASNNYVGQNRSIDVVDLLRDPANFDFRPKSNAQELIDQGREVSVTRFEGTSNEEVTSVTAGFLGSAPDIGPYEFGDTNYWIGGRQFSYASMPVPRDRGVNVMGDADLMWLGGLDGVAYDVFFGTSPENLVFQGDQTNNIFNPGTLRTNRDYYWRVDTILENGFVVTGKIWSFTRDGSPPEELPTTLPPTLPPTPEPPQINGLIAAWSMNENSGTLVSDGSGNQFAGNSENCTIIPGIAGNALAFNGSNSRVTLPTSAFESVGNQVSIAMWAFGDVSLPARNSVFYATDASGSRLLNVHLPWTNSRVYWDAGNGSGYDRIDKAATPAEYENNWNHWVFTKNASSGLMKIYLNGELWHSGSGKARAIGEVDQANFGAQASSLSYSGILDEVLLYNIELNDSEVSQLFQSY